VSVKFVIYVLQDYVPYATHPALLYVKLASVVPVYNSLENAHATLGFLHQIMLAHLVEPSAQGAIRLENVWDAQIREEILQTTATAQLGFMKVADLRV
jgi:hypothetical protein